MHLVWAFHYHIIRYSIVVVFLAYSFWMKPIGNWKIVEALKGLLGYSENVDGGDVKNFEDEMKDKLEQRVREDQQHAEQSIKCMTKDPRILEFNEKEFSCERLNDYFRNRCLFVESELVKGKSNEEIISSAIAFLNLHWIFLVTERSSLLRIDLKPHQKLHVVGDTHGQFLDLLEIFETLGNPSEGDYVDRGRHQYENIMTLFELQAVTGSVHMLRGNHEEYNMNLHYGFLDQIRQMFPNTADNTAIIDGVLSQFEVLPVAAVVNDGIFCCHGGIGIEEAHLRDVESISKLRLEGDDQYNFEEFTEEEVKSMLLGLLWSDPVDYPGVREGIGPNPRGGSTTTFAYDITEDFLERNGLNGVIRSHESSKVFGGFHYEHGGKMLTVFSCPQYCGQGNKGSVATIFGETDGVRRVDGELEITVFPESVYYS